MAIVNSTTLAALRTTIRGEFSNAFKTAQSASMWAKLATTVQSSSASNTYGWLGKFPQMQKWTDERTIRSMKEAAYQLINEKYEATLGVARTDIEDDNLGQYRTLAAAHGQEGSDFKDRKIGELIKAAFSGLCYDGQNFFDSDHPLYPKVDGTGTAGTQSNIVGTAADTGEIWVLLDLSRALKPFIIQERSPVEMDDLTDPKGEHVFMKDEYLYGSRWRGQFGYALWQQAVGSKAELTAASFNTAFRQMQEFKMDGGDPMGMRASVLLVTPGNEAAAEKIVKAQLLENGQSNTNYNKVELMVNRWL